MDEGCVGYGLGFAVLDGGGEGSVMPVEERAGGGSGPPFHGIRMVTHAIDPEQRVFDGKHGKNIELRNPGTGFLGYIVTSIG